MAKPVEKPVLSGFSLTALARADGQGGGVNRVVSGPPMSSRVVHAVRSDGKTGTRIGAMELDGPGLPDASALEALGEERDFQRACQAWLRALPTVAWAQWQNQHETVFAARDGDIVKYRSVRDKLGLMTADAAPCVAGFVNTARTGPMVVDFPAGGGTTGGFVDFRGRPIGAVGAAGPDRGRGGRYLVLGPGQAPPEGLGWDFLVRSPTFNLALTFRILTPDAGERERVTNACHIYPARQAAAPRPTRVIRPDGRPWSGTPPTGMAFWRRLNTVLQIEPVGPEELSLMVMLKPLGLEKGRPFDPDPDQIRLLEEGARIGRLMALAEAAHSGGWRRDVDAALLAEGMAPQAPGLDQASLSALRDAQGQWFDGGRAWGLHVPADTPAGEAAGGGWSLALYDVETRCFIDTPWDIGWRGTGRSSHESLARNPDGSADLIVSPQPPADAPRSNWIPTVPGRAWFGVFRLEGPKRAWFDGSWTLPEIVPL